jgi:heat shock protein HslJ
MADDGTLRGGTGCRTFAGTYLVQGGELLVTRLEMNGDCPRDLSDQDSHVVAVIGDGFRPVVEGDLLTLADPGGLGLVYESVP